MCAYFAPKYANAGGQLGKTIRAYFALAITAYQAEDQATRDAWDAAIKGKGVAMTGFNYYLGLYVKYLIENTGTPPTAPFLPPS